jgi:protein-disulfide isomerase
MDKRFLLILGAILVIFGGVFWFSKNKSTRSNNSQQGTPSNHVIGTNTTGVALVEYGDYQCPACGQFYPIVKQLQATYANKISFRFANFPLVQIHQHAMEGARAAEAASLQNKFWEMHDILYENQTTWSQASNPSAYFEQYAAQLGLNLTKFKQDMASQAVLNTINADVGQVQALGGSGTPTFVINGKKVENNPSSLEAFSKLIDDTIAAQANQKKQ